MSNEGTRPGQEIVLIPFGPGVLAFTRSEFENGAQRGQSLNVVSSAKNGAETGPPEQWLDAAAIEAASGIPATWWLDAARRGIVPHLRAGKYVRFRLSEMAEALKHRLERRS